MRILFLLVIATLTLSKSDIYESLNSDVLMLTQGNWMNQLVKGRQTEKIFLVHFYNENDGKSYEFSKEFKEKATEYKGIVHMGFVNCNTQKALCTKEAPKVLPALKLYPPNPDPTQEFELELKKSIARALSFLKYDITELTSDNAAQFLSSDVSLPKSLLFTDKPGLPLMYKALSSSFKNKLRFGIIRKEQEDLVSTYNVKKFPSVMVIKAGLKKPQPFSKEFTFKNLFEFMNIFSEQFVPTDSETSTEVKPWLFEPVPELTSKSANEICLNLERTLCVILFSPEKPSAEAIEILKQLKVEFTNKMEGNLSYKFIWMNSNKQKHWVTELGVENKNEMTVRVLNPGRRKRYVKLEDKFSHSSVKRILERISGGDARFININRDLPKLAEDL
jgi:thiol-disulfide isomerase/thioredoxin